MHVLMGRFVRLRARASSPFFLSFFDAASTSIWLAVAACLRLVCFLFAYPQPSDAPRGGRIGGGSFRSAPSFSRGGAGNFRVVAHRVAVGFGGAGSDSRSLIPDVRIRRRRPVRLFLNLMTIAGVLVNALRGRWGQAGGGGAPAVWPIGRSLCHQA